MKIPDKFKAYYRRKSRSALVFDILFYLFILLLIIPPTRRTITSAVLRVTLHQPVFIEPSSPHSIYAEDLAWELISPDGERISFSHLRDSVIFLNFWATWCPPCIAEMPAIQNLYDAYGQKISFILVSHEPSDKVSAFLEDRGYSLSTCRPTGETPEIFSHRSIPTTFIISRSGEIVIQHKGAAKWDGEKIRSMLDELISEPVGGERKPGR